MSVVVSAIKDFNAKIKHIFGYINEEDIDTETNYENLNEFKSLSKQEQKILEDGADIQEPIDFKKSLKYNGTNNKTNEIKRKDDSKKIRNKIDRDNERI